MTAPGRLAKWGAAAALALTGALALMVPASLGAAQPPGEAAPLDAASAVLKAIRALLTEPFIQGLKVPVATAGALVLWWAARPRKHRPLANGLLVVLAILAALLWGNLGKFRFTGYVHAWDTYHYYVGAKYFRELGYTRLYRCSTVADLEDGVFPPGHTRYMRNLDTNLLERVPAILIDPLACTAHFSPERWVSFKADVAWFRQRMGPAHWERALRDHGYNGTPVWGIAGTILAQALPASDTQILLLTLIDPLLLLAMWGAVAWAFGWQAMCAGLLFWGTNFPAQAGWIGGSFLRQDWLAASIVGVCLLRRGYPVGAGFALATAALLRIFPVFLLGGLLLKAGWEMWERRAIWTSSELRRVAVGCGVAFMLLVPVSALVAGRTSSWPEFVANTRKHSNTPLTNYMGLKTVLAYDRDTRVALTVAERFEEDPFAVWKAARQRVFQERWPLFVVMVFAFVLVLGWAVRHQPSWVAAVLGVGMIPVGIELTCYYYSILLAYGLLWERREIVAAALSLLAAATWVAPSIVTPGDEMYPFISTLVLAFVVFATLAVMRRTGTTPAPSAALPFGDLAGVRNRNTSTSSASDLAILPPGG